MCMLSRKATCNSHGQDSSYFLGWQEYEKNPFHEVRNTKGIIQMGLAENQVINISGQIINYCILTYPPGPSWRCTLFFIFTALLRYSQVVDCEQSRRSRIQEKWRIHFCGACSLPRLSWHSRIQKGIDGIHVGNPRKQSELWSQPLSPRRRCNLSQWDSYVLPCQSRRSISPSYSILPRVRTRFPIQYVKNIMYCMLCKA